MSFADELRRQQPTRRYSDEDVYQNILQCIYQDIKLDLKQVAAHTNSNVISGIRAFESLRCHLPINQLENKSSSYHLVVPDEYGPKINVKNTYEAIIKPNLISGSKAKIWQEAF